MGSSPQPPPSEKLRVDPVNAGQVYEHVQASEEFQRLRSTFRRFVFPVTAFFLLWYFLYVLLSIFAPKFMGTKVIGNINIGLLMGLGQFVTTFAITLLYSRWAGHTLDPQADAAAALLEPKGSLQ